jgi:hypothetical protein
VDKPGSHLWVNSLTLSSHIQDSSQNGGTLLSQWLIPIVFVQGNSFICGLLDGNLCQVFEKAHSFVQLQVQYPVNGHTLAVATPGIAGLATPGVPLFVS